MYAGAHSGIFDKDTVDPRCYAPATESAVALRKHAWRQKSCSTVRQQLLARLKGMSPKPWQQTQSCRRFVLEKTLILVALTTDLCVTGH